MNLAEATRAVFARWIQEWPTRSGGVAFALEGNPAPEGVPYCASVSIQMLDSEQASLGPPGRRRWERMGIIQVRLTGPLGEGRGPVDELVQHVVDVYEGQRIGRAGGEHGVVTHALTPEELRRDPEAKHRRVVLCTVPFEFTERR